MFLITFGESAFRIDTETNELYSTPIQNLNTSEESIGISDFQLVHKEVINDEVYLKDIEKLHQDLIRINALYKELNPNYS